MAAGTRLIDLPAISVVTDATEFTAAGPGAGQIPASVVRDYMAIGINGPPTGFFFQSAGARIARLSDRLFVGAARNNDGNAFPNAGGADFVTTNIPQGPTTSAAQMASMSTRGTIGVLGATRTSDASLADAGLQGGIGVMGVVINDATDGKKQGSFAGYFEAQRKVGAGFTSALEVDTANQSGVVTGLTPYTFFNDDKTVNIWSAAGGARGGVVNSSAAIAILANGAKYEAGIVFQTGCLETNIAVSMDKGHALHWWGGAAVPTSFISSTAATSNYGVTFTDLGTFIGNSPAAASTASLAVANQAGAVDYVKVTGAASGTAVRIQADGTSANVNLSLLPKGATGKLVLGGPAGATSATGGSASALPGAPAFYLAFQFNNDGINYKIPVYNT